MVEHLAWPGAVVLLGLVGMFLFRGPLGRLLDRTRKVSKSGLETLEPPQLPAPAARPDPLSEFLATFDNPFLLQQEAQILADLAKLGLTEHAASHKALVRSLAGTQIILLFERAQGLIWASQVAALTYLNSRGGFVPVEEVRPFFDDARVRFPDIYRNYALDAWLRFLQSWLLVELRGDTIAISVAGREFLKWRIEAGRAGPFHG